MVKRPAEAMSIGEDADLALDALLAYAKSGSHAVSVSKSTDSGESVDITKSVVK